MSKKNNPSSSSKSKLHPRNQHQGSYDFDKLKIAYPPLSNFIIKNKYQNTSIDFFNPAAVIALNKALLIQYYAIDFWEIPNGYLCPPIPGRADYIHYLADILGEKNQGKTPKGNKIKCLDIGVGANCIYPIIGSKEYGWSFVGSDIAAIAIENCNNIITKNKTLQNHIEVRQQKNPKTIFEGVIEKDEYFDLSICNPPFHSSAEAAKKGSVRKLSNLKKEKIKNPVLNFGGKNNELWTEGGEAKFIENMISESVKQGTSVFYFSTLVSKQSNLKKLTTLLEKVKVKETKVIPMGQGNKTSHILAWSFLSEKQQKIWKNSRW